MQQQLEFPDKKFNNRVKVAIRIRPFIERQRLIDDNTCVQVVSNTEVILGNQKLFKFDKVFDQNSQQTEVYDSCVKDLVSQCFQGYNSAILAYGQTGSGKTFTMGTTSNSKIPPQDRGILPRVINHIFQQSRQNSHFRYTIKATFLEIYNEQIIDLLSEEHGSNKNIKESTIAIRQEKDGSVMIYGANEEEVTCEQEMLELLDKGSFHRTTSSTLMNDASSRSHAIFTIWIERNTVGSNTEIGIDENYVTSKFVFVDLAGSERLKKTGATGNTLKQGININLGLLELGNVISSLAVEKKQTKYINYRNSKLTRILQDSLGGNSNTYMIACISPAESNYQESLNTIKYASKAMNIKNKPVINRDPQQAHILKLRGVIEVLEKENAQLRKVLTEKGIDIGQVAVPTRDRVESLIYANEGEEISRLKTRNAILEKKCQSLIIENKQQTKKSNELEISLYEARRSKDILEIKIQKLLNGQALPQDDNSYTPLIETYLNKIQLLETEIHQKQKSISQMEIEYTKLYESAERDAILLTKKNQRIFGLEKKLKILERQIKDLTQSQKGDEMERMSRMRINSNTDSDVLIDGPNDQSIEVDNQGNCEHNQINPYSQILSSDDLQQLQSLSHLEQDTQYLSQASMHQSEHQKLDTQLKNLEKNIQDREAFYADINEHQMNLEYKLIEEMKQEYHQKIRQLERERERLVQGTKANNSSREQMGNIRNNHHEEKAKIVALQNEMKELKKKAKEQKQLEKQVSTQSSRLKQLNQEINSFKLQKIQLNRKMKEEKEKFNKFKSKRIKELFDAKKDNAKKQGQIRKLKTENNKHIQQAVKRKEEMKRIKKVNETLKQLMKPKKLVRGSLAIIPQNGSLTDRHSMSTSTNPFSKRRGLSAESLSAELPLSQDQYDTIISESIKSILIQIDKDIEKQKIIERCDEIEKEINNLKEQQSELNIKKERLEIKQESRMISGEEVGSYVDLEREQKEQEILEQIKLELNVIEERLINLEEDLEFKMSRYDDLTTSYKYFNHETEIIYNKRYQSIESFRAITLSLYRSIFRMLTENLQLKERSESLAYHNGQLQKDLSELKEQLFNVRNECQQRVEQMREEYQEMKIQLELQRDSRNNDLTDLENYSAIGNETHKMWQFGQKNEEQIKKKYEKKIEELSKNNKALVKELQIQRKKCQTMTEKYNNLKSIFTKDRFIGITVRQEDGSNSGQQPQQGGNHAVSFQQYRQKRMETITKQPQNQNQHVQNFSNTNVNESSEEFNNNEANERERFIHDTRGKRQVWNRQVQENPERLTTIMQDLQFNKNTWELAAEINNAHKSPILSLATHDNIMASSASKSVAIWDLETNELVREFSNLPTFVKSVVIHPQRQIMFTTSDKSINVWDLRTFKSEMTLKGHKDEIRQLHIHKDSLFSAGKGTINGGSLLVWDLRGSMSFENIVEKEKNQDIFSMTSKDDILYYGTRDHFVRRMKIQNNETLLQFQPPHMDTVTGLATLGNYLISGSKDKNLRLWSLESSMYNLKSTVHSFNEYITSVQSDDYLPLFYASDRSGQIKIGTIKKEKIEFVGGILAHSQQINAICKVNASPNQGLFATGSNDKTIKMWRPSRQTLEHICKDY